MVTKRTWTFASGVVLLCGAWSAACGDTGTPVDNTGVPSGAGDAGNGSGSRSGSDSGGPGSGSSASAGGDSAAGSGASGSSGSFGSGSADAGSAPIESGGPPVDASGTDSGVDAGARADAGAGSRSDGGGTIHWGTDVLPLLDSNCTNACHGGCGNLTISYAMIVNVKSGEVTRLNYITPRDPGHSYLWCKIDPTDTSCTQAGTTITGNRMPPPNAAALPANNLATIKTWITQGALNN